MSSVFMNNTTAASVADSLPKARWAKTGLLLFLVLTAIVALFYETAWSIVSIWIRSETYAHGFLIVRNRSDPRRVNRNGFASGQAAGGSTGTALP
jgi:hypothetical protein